MKKILVIVSVVLLLFCSCASNLKSDGVVYESYGLLNKEENRNSGIQYRLCTGNLILAIIFCETIVMPIYFFGFSLYEPVGKKPQTPYNFANPN